MDDNDKIKEYIIIFELLPYREVDIDIIKTKYRELARRFHPDITQRDTNGDMAIINVAFDILSKNIKLVNQELFRILSQKEIEFEKIYLSAILTNYLEASIRQLEKSISLLKSITNYKDANFLVLKYENRLKQLVTAERDNEIIYNAALIDINSTTITEIKDAISRLHKIIDYKDSRLLINKYQIRIADLEKEELAKSLFYDKAKKLKSQSLKDNEIEELIRRLKTLNYLDSNELLDYYYKRLNQVSSIEVRLENEVKEKEYQKYIESIPSLKSITDFEKLINGLESIKDYKDVQYIIIDAKEAIKKIKINEENNRKTKLLDEAISLMKDLTNNENLKEAIRLLKIIDGFKNSKSLIEKALNQIFDNEDNKRKEKIYEYLSSKYKQAIILNELEECLDIAKRLEGFKDSVRISNEIEQMILCYKENVYKKASELLHLSNNKNVKMLDDSIDEFSRITDFLDSKEKIESIKKVILKIKNQQKLDEQQRLEEKYQRGLLVPQEKISISMLKNKINILLENKDYKDSSKLIDLYKKHLLLLETDKKKLISELGVSITSNISIKQVNEILSTKMPQSQKEALSKILLEETNIIDEFNKRINNNTLELMYRNEELKNGRASNNSKA